ncbi:MAG: hypothetical protein VKP62_05960 [Candidatus Sericytochromatia bacterium]|nr:hypothetical protein [Candidatus Sericytochromatia bacterium]
MTRSKTPLGTAGARAGISLVEVSLAIVVGLIVASASVYTYQQVRASARLKEAQMIVGTVQSNIAVDKFRLGQAPPLAATPSPYASVFGVSLNVTSAGGNYHPQGGVNTLPADPVSGYSTVLAFDSQASPVPLVAGAPTPQWDNPVFLSPGPSPGYGNGGWLYDQTQGAFRLNYSNQQYPAERPARW